VSETAISHANRNLQELAEEQEQTSAKLEALALVQTDLVNTVTAQKQQLAALLREQYVAGNEDHLKLLLSGDNPNRISRDLQLMAYVAQAKARLLESLRSNLAAVETNQLKEQNAKAELDEIAQEEQEQKSILEKEKAKRAALLRSLSKRLADQRKELGSLERADQRMAGLVDRLSKLIREQAEAAAAEKRRRQLLAEARAKAAAEAKALAAARAKAKAESERLAQQAAKPGAKPSDKPAAPFKPDPIDADEPAPLVNRQAAPVTTTPDEEPVDLAALGPAAPDGAFARLRGTLRAPVSGTLAATFGAARGGGPNWKGVFIKAPEGSEVRAVAPGRIVFAAWMRGFGNLIIVDHGSAYLSIYGNNQALLGRVGDAVKTGERIASAGNTGGNAESGLYFEIRHNGKAINPAGWVSF
jgi:septal ring factor EnvC (AmiA/AmiB activator)